MPHFTKAIFGGDGKMFEQYMWNRFLKSGSVYDYLVLKEEMSSSDILEKEANHTNQKNGNTSVLKII